MNDGTSITPKGTFDSNPDILPIPDGTIGQNDRQTLLRVYGGILADAAAEVIRRLNKISINIGLSI